MHALGQGVSASREHSEEAVGDGPIFVNIEPGNATGVVLTVEDLPGLLIFG
jgi:hypothetical protein